MTKTFSPGRIFPLSITSPPRKEKHTHTHFCYKATFKWKLPLCWKSPTFSRTFSLRNFTMDVLCRYRHRRSRRKASFSRSWFLHHAVQPHRAAAAGPRPAQLQALSIPQPVRHPQRAHHLNHASHLLRRLLLRLGCPLSRGADGGVSSDSSLFKPFLLTDYLFFSSSYATVYTMFPVFSLVLDKDVSGKIALTYPELYKELSKGRSLSFKTFFIWVLISIYQGNPHPSHIFLFF